MVEMKTKLLVELLFQLPSAPEAMPPCHIVITSFYYILT
jgi:hypothetical protein